MEFSRKVLSVAIRLSLHLHSTFLTWFGDCSSSELLQYQAQAFSSHWNQAQSLHLIALGNPGKSGSKGREGTVLHRPGPMQRDLISISSDSNFREFNVLQDTIFS